MNNDNQQRQIWLLGLIGINIVASILHYSDNIIFFKQYPEPSWFTPQITDSCWLVMTPLGLAGYYQYIKRSFNSAYLCLYLYIIMSQLTLGQYIITPMWELSMKMNTLILFEAVATIPLLAFVAWSQLLLKEGKQAT
ncbi:hypothetical protein NIES37_25470 [Tolypothrix tenuis PCC 7101]|uniref:Uncharacterized protein n=1 Tax=Tolypothrix tenuis PCC 7101 TaxID=231146 RepID=A0A1Z4MYM5_9CYAN|nr:hypothetical protein [Aulosira sp. FACHB-113]BAY98595.1 hypothetical protein NIES37_25470 [Tolypothrix tenuis PCC 7101]BAZ77487.1 hypothetical protein NIES50_61160 [Aulosira laxa NIES-50]